MTTAIVSPLRRARLEESLSVEMVAAQAGVSASTIRMIEQGWAGFSLETGNRIAAVLGMTAEQLI